MSNESLEQRARELYDISLRRHGNHEEAYHVGCGAELNNQQQAVIDAIIAALESTPAQGVAAHRLVMPGYPTDRFTWVDGDCSPDEESSWATHGWVVERAYGQACASARAAPAEGDVLLTKLQELVEKWRTASDDAHEEGGHYHAGEVVAYDQCADELENTFHTARPAKAEGDVLHTAIYNAFYDAGERFDRMARWGEVYGWVIDKVHTARTVSRGESNG